MTYQHFNAVVDSEETFESPTERYLYLECCYRANSKGRILMPQTTLAQITQLSLRTVASLFKLLEGKELITRDGHGNYRVAILPAMPTRVATEIQVIPAVIPDRYRALKLWLKGRENDGLVFDSEFDDERQLITTDGEEFPDFVKTAITEGKLMANYPEDTSEGRLMIYSINIEY